MGLLEDAKAAEEASATVVADLESTGSSQEGTYVLTPTANGYLLELTAAAPAAPADAANPVAP